MRQRMLHPEYWGDSGLTKAFPYKGGDYPGRCLYQFLWNYAEDSGVFVPDMGDIKMKFAAGDPFDEAQIEAWLNTLIHIRKVIPFHADDGCDYAWLKRFRRWQRLDNPTPPRMPLPPWVRWVNENLPGENKRSKWKYVVEDYDFSMDPPRPRQAARPEPVRPPAREPFPKSAPALVPKARFRDAAAGIEGRGDPERRR